jgi:hypothetical protein
MINATGYFDDEASMSRLKPYEIDGIKNRIRTAAADMGIQILPPFQECEQCHEQRHLVYRVRSDEINVRVCFTCGEEARRLVGIGKDGGQLTVERL